MALEKYIPIKKLGSGSFGTVWQAVNKRTGEIVAVKILKEKFNSWEECLNLPEIKVLSKVMKHANIVKLKEVIWLDYVLYLVFEYMEGNDMYDLIYERREPFSEDEVKKWCFQVFHALSYMHSRGFIHRDIKPENLLLSKDNNAKIADFGVALDIYSQDRDYYVGTHNYRAPEILLHSTNYDYAVDMWAMGATMAELLCFHPLFPGSSEEDQLNKICMVIGSPKVGEWDEGLELARVLNYEFAYTAGLDLSALIPSASEDAIDLIKLLCCWDPRKRPTATQVLQHRFFQGALSIPPFLCPKVAADSSGDERKQNYSENEQRDLMKRTGSLLNGVTRCIANCLQIMKKIAVFL